MGFILQSAIKIGNFSFSGVHEVRIERSLHSYADKAFIKIPHVGVVKYKNSDVPQKVSMSDLFNDGDAVSIDLGYKPTVPTPGGGSTGLTMTTATGLSMTNMVNEFKGFVLRRNLNMPIEIECEGYVRSLRLGQSFTYFFKHTTVKDLLNLITKGDAKNANTGINVICDVDIPILNLGMTKAAGVNVIDEIKKLTQNTVSIFFINPTTLWCGLTYTPYVGTANVPNGNDPFGLGTVNYRLGWNTPRQNSLKQRTVLEPVQVIFKGLMATGQRVTTEAQTISLVRHETAVMNNIQSEPVMKLLAKEKQYRMNYVGYEGSISGFLQPYCSPGYQLNITDDNYKERNGIYMCEGTKVTFGRWLSFYY